MYCSKCGKEVPDDANFCKYCGYDFSNDKNETGAIANDDSEIVTEIVDKNKGNAPIFNDSTPCEAVDESEPQGFIDKKISKRKKIRKQRDIEDAMALDNYTIRDDMVDTAEVLPKDRIKLTSKGSIASLKTREIIYVIICGLFMIVSAVVIGLINHYKKVEGESMAWLVILGYFLFFIVFFALAIGVDRIYNILTLNELSVRHITLKKFGFRLTPLALVDGKVYSIEINGECDKCNGENKGTYHIEWQNDNLIAVCNFDRKHLYKIDIKDIISKDNTNDTPKEDK